MKDIRTWPGDAMADYEGVERFSTAMLDKLAKKRGEGRGGWNREPEHEGCSLELLRQMFRDHLEKGDMVDIANFAMMIWNRENPEGKRLTQPSAPDSAAAGQQSGTEGKDK